MDRAQKQHMLEELKLEREFVRRGGYHASVRNPRREPTHLRDSVTCLNVNKSEDLEPCDRCFWYDLVPEERRDREMPCRHIPLDAQGNTVDSLDARGRREEAEEKLLAWLDSTIARLEKELAQA